MNRIGLVLTIIIFTVGFAASYCLSLLSSASIPKDGVGGSSVYDDKESGRTFDFGRVKSGDVVQHDFRLRNDTANAKRVTATRTSCGCTVVERTPDALAPHSSAALRVSVHTDGKSGVTNQTVLVQLDAQEWVAFQVTGFVEGTRLATLDFGDVSHGQDYPDMHFTIQAAKLNGIEVKHISFDKDYLNIDDNSPPKADEISYTVGLVGSIPYGPFSKIIEIETTDTINPVKTVVAKGNILYPVLVEPRELMLGEFQPGESRSGSVRFYSPIDRPVSIQDIILADGDPIEWKIEQRSHGEQSVVVTMKRGESTRKVLKSVLTVKAKSGTDTLPLKVEVYGLAAP